METHTHSLHPAMYELMQQEQYTAEEVAALFEISLPVVRHAAFTGELHARILNHHIITIRRDDVLIWLAERDGRTVDRRAEPLN